MSVVANILNVSGGVHDTSIKSMTEQNTSTIKIEDCLKTDRNDFTTGSAELSTEIKHEKLRFFSCPKCDLVAFQRFEDLLHHQKETHNFLFAKPLIHPGVKIEPKLKRYICCKCKLEFKNAFLLSNHIDENECKEIVQNNEGQPLFKQDTDGLWVCPECDYKVKTKHLMSKHLKYFHFQRKACFVSRDENLRKAAVSYEEEKEQAEIRRKKLREERLAINREKRRIREIKKQERMELEASQAAKVNTQQPPFPLANNEIGSQSNDGQNIKSNYEIKGILKNPSAPKQPRISSHYDNPPQQSVLDLLGSDPLDYRQSASQQSVKTSYFPWGENKYEFQRLSDAKQMTKKYAESLTAEQHYQTFLSKQMQHYQSPITSSHTPPVQTTTGYYHDIPHQPAMFSDVLRNQYAPPIMPNMYSSMNKYPTHLVPWGPVSATQKYEPQYTQRPRIIENSGRKSKKLAYVPQIPVENSESTSDVSSANSFDLKNSILVPKMHIPPPKKIIHDWKKGNQTQHRDSVICAAGKSSADDAKTFDRNQSRDFPHL